jgi:curli biogenesis system outer membrane secretion channel CsgG
LVDKRVVLAMVLLLLVSVGYGRAPRPISVAMVPFDGPDTTVEARALGQRIAEHVSSFLARSGMLQVVERSQMEKLL